MAAREDNMASCTVCFDSPMEPPIYQCYDGHVMCSRCEKQLKDCPTCRAPLPKEKKIRCRALENLQPEPETLRCPNGPCPESFKFSGQVEEHHKLSCPYRKVKLCKLLAIDPDFDCNVSFSSFEAREAATHLLTCHGKFCSTLAPKALQNTLSVGCFRLFICNQRLVIFEFLTFERTRMVKVKPFILAPRAEIEYLSVTVTSWMWYNYGAETVEEVKRSKLTRKNVSSGPLWSLIQLQDTRGCIDTPCIHVGTDTSKCMFEYEIAVVDE